MLNLPINGGIPDPYVPPDGTWNVTGNITASGTISAAAFTATGFTQGSVVFAGASGAFTEDNTNFFWDDTANQLVLGSGTVTAPAYTFTGDVNTGMYRVGADSIAFTVGGAAGLTLATTGGTLTQAISTSGSPTLLTLTGAAHTTLTASAEAIDVNLNLGRTVQFATGAITTQRAISIAAPTYGFVGASTITSAYTVYVDSPPVAGTNATLSNRYAAFLGGSLRIEMNPASGFPLLWLHNSTGGGNSIRILFTNATWGSATTDGAIIDLDTSNLNIRFQDAGGLMFGTSNTNRWNINSSGHLLGAADNTYDIGASGGNRVANIYAYTTINTADGTAGAPGFRFVDDANTGIYRGGTDILGFSTAGAARMTIDATGDFVLTQGVSTTGSPIGLTFTGGAHTTLTASTEATDVDFDLSRTVEFAAGALTLQRAFRIENPTYGFAGASTLTDAYTFYVDAPPAPGTNATITRAWAGFMGGPLELNGTPTDTNMLLAVRSNTVNSVMRFHASDTGTAASDGLEIGILSSAARVLNREAGALAIGTTALTRLSISAGGTLTHTMSAQSSGAHTMHTMTAAANTGQTASTEIPDVLFDLARTNTWATGALALQRAFRITQPTYAFAGASTLTTAATCAIAGAPTQGSNATITQSFALYFDAGAVTLASAAGMTTAAIYIPSRTVTVTGTTQVTSLNAEVAIDGTTYTDSSAVTMDVVTGLNVVAPTAAGSVTMTQVSAARVATSTSYATHAAGFNYAAYRVGAHTLTFTGTTQITSSPAAAGVSIGQITLTNSLAHTIDNAASLYIVAAPVAGGSVTLSNAYAIWVDAGITRLDGVVYVSDGSAGAPAIGFQSNPDVGIYMVNASNELSFAINGVERFRVQATGVYVPNAHIGETFQSSSNTNRCTFQNLAGLTITQFAQTSGTNSAFLVTAGANTNQTASTEVTDVNFNLARTVEFATGALTTQRAFRIQAPTYAFVGASTLTVAATVEIGGGPTQGANATITQSINLLMAGGAITLASASGALSSTLLMSARTVTFTGTTQITTGGNAALFISSITYTDASAVTLDVASTVNISAPIGAGSVAITSASGYRLADNVSYATHAAGFNYAGYRMTNHTVTFTATTQITATPAAAGMFLGQITLTNAGAHTIDNAATLYITGALVAGGSVVITNNYALWVDAGVARFDGDGTTVFAVPTLAATDTTITRKIRILDGATTYWVAATTNQ